MKRATFRKEWGCWWPHYDKSPEVNHKRVLDRVKDVHETVKLVHNFGVCVQAGGHVGFWPLELAKYFATVYTFEPDPNCFLCLARNVDMHNSLSDNIVSTPCALGPRVGEVKLKTHPSAGSWRVSPEGTVETSMITIDRLDLKSCGAIVLDVEGFELDVLLGARMTIAKYRPVIHLEALPGNETRYDNAMQKLGYARHHKVHSDVVYMPR